ncbi:MAG: hypothetical protein WCT85_03570 [Parachlamydiales bacterium]
MWSIEAYNLGGNYDDITYQSEKKITYLVLKTFNVASRIFGTVLIFLSLYSAFTGVHIIANISPLKLLSIGLSVYYGLTKIIEVTHNYIMTNDNLLQKVGNLLHSPSEGFIID